VQEKDLFMNAADSKSPAAPPLFIDVVAGCSRDHANSGGYVDGPLHRAQFCAPISLCSVGDSLIVVIAFAK
jgi:hypothetical protein